MFKTIVLCLDGSEGSQRAVPLAVELAKRDGAEIVIVHVEEKLAAKGGPDVHAEEREIQAEVRRQAKELSDIGVRATVKMATVMPGGPAHAIAKIAEDADADLIVVGTRGHSSVAGLLLGGVTQRLLHIAHQPVLAVPPSQHSGRSSRSQDREEP